MHSPHRHQWEIISSHHYNMVVVENCHDLSEAIVRHAMNYIIVFMVERGEVEETVSIFLLSPFTYKIINHIFQ